MDSSTENLMFLLAAAPMGMGACIITGSDDTATTAAATSDPMDSSESGATAHEAAFVCISTLTCEEFMVPEPPGCADEWAAVEQACVP